MKREKKVREKHIIQEEEDAKGKRCGTDLFYEYLCDNNYLNSTKCIEQFVELTKPLLIEESDNSCIREYL